MPPRSANPLGNAFQTHRPADDEALGDVALHLRERLEHFAAFDSFGDHSPPERVGKSDRRLDHHPVAAVVEHAFDEALVDLDLAGRDLLQIVEGRQAGAVIVDRNRSRAC